MRGEVWWQTLVPGACLAGAVQRCSAAAQQPSSRSRLSAQIAAGSVLFRAPGTTSSAGAVRAGVAWRLSNHAAAVAPPPGFSIPISSSTPQVSHWGAPPYPTFSFSHQLGICALTVPPTSALITRTSSWPLFAPPLSLGRKREHRQRERAERAQTSTGPERHRESELSGLHSARRGLLGPVDPIAQAACVIESVTLDCRPRRGRKSKHRTLHPLSHYCSYSTVTTASSPARTPTSPKCLESCP